MPMYRSEAVFIQRDTKKFQLNVLNNATHQHSSLRSMFVRNTNHKRYIQYNVIHTMLKDRKMNHCII